MVDNRWPWIGCSLIEPASGCLVTEVDGTGKMRQRNFLSRACKRLIDRLRGHFARRPSAGDRPLLEIQYHPPSIRYGVWYFFLSQRQIVRLSVVAALYVSFLLFSLVVTPAAVRSRVYQGQYQRLLDQRARFGERLHPLVDLLAELERETDAARIEMAKIYLAYGFSYEESRGLGGYPFVPEQIEGDPKYKKEVEQGNRLRARASEQLGVLGTFLEEVQSFEQADQLRVRTTPSIAPLRGRDFVLTSPFGSRRDPFTEEFNFHAGIDMAAPTGLPIYATADGVVAFAGRYPLKRSVGWWRYGKMVMITHGEHFVSIFGHCDEILDLRAGQRVEKGQQIATVGNTGHSTNPHLHYEIRRRDEQGDLGPVDPRIYILDHRWTEEELLLVLSRQTPDASEYEPLPRIARR